MDISTIANLINAFAVTAGLIFAATQIRYYRQRRRRDAMIELVRSFQNPSFTSAFRRVLSLPDDATTEQIREKLGPDGEETVYLVALTWESLGVMLFRGEVTIDLIDDFFSGPILISWRKLNVFVEEDRRALDRNTVSEWFQWLAERMIQREKRIPALPAHIAHREWK
jgi:superfamily I DNA/RNA helicase